MTEHEKRVNEKELKAYECMDNNSYSMLPGFRSNLEMAQDKFLEKSLFNSQSHHNKSV